MPQSKFNGLITILDQFEKTSLKEMSSVKLMNRIDTKFVFSFDQLATFLQEMRSSYTCLSFENKCIANYKTQYYDTEELKFYYQHLNGKLNRFKIRERTYLNSNEVYLEAKFKNNKGRTIKSRVKQTVMGLNFSETLPTLIPNMDLELIQRLKPGVVVLYKRITLVNRQAEEKLTFDFDLEFRSDSKRKCLDNLVIAELKQSKKLHSSFSSMAKKAHLKPCSMSKYCLAIALTNNQVKKNNFKEQFLSLKHIINHDTLATII